MNKIAVALVVLALAMPVGATTLTADPVSRSRGGSVGSPSRGWVVYDDTVAVPEWGFAWTPGSLIGDDLYLDMTGAPGNILDDFSFSVFNGGPWPDKLLDSCDVDLSFYDLNDFTFVGAVSFPGLHPSLAPGYYTTYHAADLGTLNIALPAELLAIIRIYNVMGGADRVGQIIVNPIAVGSSSDMFWLDDTVATPPGPNQGWYWFSGEPDANFYWQIGVIPEPASLLLVALNGLVLIRRR